MSIGVSLPSDPALLQRVQTPSGYGTHVKHDWEAKSFERFFEGGSRPEGQRSSESLSARAETESALQRAVNGAPGSTARALALTGRTESEIPNSGASAVTEDFVNTLDADPAHGLPVSLQPYELPGSISEAEYGSTALDDIASPESVLTSGTSYAAAAEPTRSAIIVGVSDQGAHVLIRNADLQPNDIDRLRNLIASELGWAGLSLASLKLNGQSPEPSGDPAAPRNDAREVASDMQSSFELANVENR